MTSTYPIHIQSCKEKTQFNLIKYKMSGAIKYFRKTKWQESVWKMNEGVYYYYILLFLYFVYQNVKPM